MMDAAVYISDITYTTTCKLPPNMSISLVEMFAMKQELLFTKKISLNKSKIFSTSLNVIEPL
jgi:hypothetical protein